MPSAMHKQAAGRAVGAMAAVPGRSALRAVRSGAAVRPRATALRWPGTARRVGGSKCSGCVGSRSSFAAAPQHPGVEAARADGMAGSQQALQRQMAGMLTPLASLLLAPLPSGATLLDTTDGDFVGLDIFVAMNIALLLFLVALPSLLGTEFFKGDGKK
mmetsp:Transcript_27179/g.68341  ORF Transcript_27179/g.68341 Transcript_27179/m.68341 type:complete len:159 (+) Transcript_27179:164-640(+)